MSKNDKFSIIAGFLFFILAMYFLYIQSYLYALGLFILSVSLFLGTYNPRETGRREVLIIIDVILPFIALAIFIYTLIY